jgi:hypothetical protein
MTHTKYCFNYLLRACEQMLLQVTKRFENGASFQHFVPLQHVEIPKFSLLENHIFVTL